MREECKHFQSRTYSTGEVVRFCELDLAPEAPWRCPEDCKAYERRMMGAGWVQGSLVEPAVEDEPDVASGDAIELLEQAEDIVDAVVPETLSEVREREAREGKRGGTGRRSRWPWRKS